MRIDVMGIPFDSVTMDEAVDAAVSLMERPETAYCVTPNAEIVYESFRNSELKRCLVGADLILPDGGGVVMASKILKTPLKQKVAGFDFGLSLMARLQDTDKTFYFLGGKPGVAEQAAEKLRQRFPQLHICGVADGYFQEEEPVLAAIREKRPDVLLVCLGAPKQELFMDAHRGDISAGLMLGLGGSLDGFAGNVKRAPKWMIRCNLEWLYRLIQEPSRFRRQLRLPKFLFAVVKKRLRG